MSDISVQGVLLVEGLFKRRQPLPSSDAIYFIQPSKENIIMFLSDMSGREPLYRKAFVYFSSPVTKDLVTRIKNDSSVLPRIGALKEMNLEYFIIDKQGFITDQERSLEELFGGDGENSRRFDACLNVMAKRVATVFASLKVLKKEFPFVRYRAAKESISDFPQTETCELLIVDRSVDQIAPIIHEWTYDAMCHDLLNLDGNKYVHEVPNKSGGHPEKKEVVLEDHDPIWLELRHSHIAEASERLHDKMKNFVAKNKAAQLQQRDGNELSTRDLSKLVQALPQYSEQMERLSLHIEIADKLNKIIRNVGLQEIGQLEQDLVFGDAEPEEVRKFLTRNQEGLSENKLRLLMIYAAVYPEKFEGDKVFKLMQLARLSDGDMKAVKNMRLIEGSDSRKASETFSLKFVSDKGKSAIRKDRTGEEQTWTLFRFYPIIEELIEKLSKGGLPKDEYHCMNNPSPLTKREAASVRAGQSVVPLSMRSRRTPTWARSCSSTDACSSDASMRSGFKKMGPRIFVFIIGGATRSELRVCHKLTEKLGREVVLGTTSIDDPHQYITLIVVHSKT